MGIKVLIMEIKSFSKEDTIKIGKEYGKSLQPGDIILLNGEMGAGKTVFTKGIALALGIEDEILSPTYAYMNEYNNKLYHFDCYRLSSGEDAESLGLTDYFYAGGISVIEWSENISDVLPKKVKIVEIKKIGENERVICL